MTPTYLVCGSRAAILTLGLLEMAELAPADLKRRGHLGRGRSTIASKTHERKNHEGDHTLVDDGGSAVTTFARPESAPGSWLTFRAQGGVDPPMRLSLLSAGLFLWYTRLGTDQTAGLAVREQAEQPCAVACDQTPPGQTRTTSGEQRKRTGTAEQCGEHCTLLPDP